MALKIDIDEKRDTSAKKKKRKGKEKKERRLKMICEMKGLNDYSESAATMEENKSLQ